MTLGGAWRRAARSAVAAFSCLAVLLALVACTPERDGEIGADPTASAAVADGASGAGCASPTLFCVAVVTGPGRPLGGQVAVDVAPDLIVGVEVQVRHFSVADAGREAAVVTAAVGTAADLVVVLPAQGVEAHVLDTVVWAAEAWPESRFLTVAAIDAADRLLGVEPSADGARALTLDNLAVVGYRPAAWAGVAADAVGLPLAASADADTDAGEGDDTDRRVGVVLGSDLDPAATAFATGFVDALGDGWLAEIVHHPGALDGTNSDAGWDASALDELVQAGVAVVVADIDGLEGAELPCVVLGPRPDPAPGCAVAVVDPGVDAAVERIVVRRSGGTGPSGLVPAEPTLTRVARPGD